MAYKNGKEILPNDLLEQLQNYIQGELIYIPKKQKKRAGWGELNGTKETIKRRNHEIYNLYKKGSTIDNLVKEYHLSEDSIRRIVSKGCQLIG